MKPGERFRELLRAQPFIQTSGVYSAIQARMAEAVGLRALFLSGYSCSLGLLGKPDLGFATLTEMVGWARAVAGATSVPVIADGDNGHGNVLNVMRTVEEFEGAGVAGITLEDQVLPKRCGHMPGVRCVPVEEAAGKIRAACAARSDPSLVIVARTDIISAEGGDLPQAIERGARYADAGADLLWPEFPRPDRESAEAFARGMRDRFPALPLFFNYSSSFRWSEVEDRLTFQELGAMGYKFIVIGLGAIHAGMAAEWDFLADLVRNGERAQVSLERRLRGHATESHHLMGGLDEYLRLSAEFETPTGTS
jgi:isocitrate lyase